MGQFQVVHTQVPCPVVEFFWVGLLANTEAKVLKVPAFLFAVFRDLVKRASRMIPFFVGPEVEVCIKVDDAQTFRRR